MNIFQKDYRGNVFAQLLFLWLDKLFIKGFRANITTKDLQPCPIEQCSENVCQKFDMYWHIESQKQKPDIKIALAKTVKPLFLIAIIFVMLEGLFLVAQAILIKNVSSCSLDIGNNTITNIGPSIAYTLALALSTMCTPIFHGVSYHLTDCATMQMRTVCIVAIYKKILHVQQKVLHGVSTGYILNLVSNDVYKFDLGLEAFASFFITPIIIILSIILILVFVGPIGLIGIAYLIIHTPLQTVIGILFGYLKSLQSKTTDNRIRLMDQIIRGMNIIKFYVWERPFRKYINRIRKKEVFYANLAGAAQSSIHSLYDTSLFIALFLIDWVSIVLNQPLNPSQLAYAFLLFNIISFFLIYSIGEAIFGFRDCLNAFKRIQLILELPDGTPNSYECSTEQNFYVKLEHFSASWVEKESLLNKNLVLRDISLYIDHPQLVIVTGPIGSGKSSLILSLIKELPGLSGELRIIGKTSYCAQEPWIFSGSLRDNILFGNKLNSERYWEVVNACSLREDIDTFENGDLTLVGERGVTLSGGQKARVSLARSLYHEADIYLLDDPLSSVDQRVGREIFLNGIQGILRDKIVLLVTHHVRYLPLANLVVVMAEGTVVCKGSYQFVAENCDYLNSLLRNENNVIENKIANKAISLIDSNPNTCDFLVEEDKEENSSIQPLSSSLTAEDYRSKSIGVITYFRYFWTGGFLATLALITLTVLSTGSLLLAYRGMQHLALCSSLLNETNGTNFFQVCPWYVDPSNALALRLLALLIFLGSALVFFRGFNFYYVLLQANRRLHNRMLRSLIETPMHFFNTNPSGRILNRFSKDIGFMDEQLPIVFYKFWSNIAYSIGVAIGVCITNYFMIIPFFLLAVSTLSLRFYYLKSSKQIKLLESVSRSPLYSHISLTLQGLSTIRALGIEERMTQDLHYFQNEHSRAWYYYICGERWFGTKIDFLCALTIAFGIFSAFFSQCVYLQDNLISFYLPLLISIALTFQYTVRLSGLVELFMVSADRVMKYCDLPRERLIYRDFTSEIVPPSPSQNRELGKVEFKDVSFRYSADLPYVLHDVSLTIFSGEKIGIIGRTGSGKSSLFNSLLRISEISSGQITVGLDNIQTINLYEHRKTFSVLPQDPVLFSGTLRYNLDPFGQFSASEIWDALSKSHLKDMVECLPGQLSANVEQDGFNFSTGERQLLCLARAILGKNRIILIDEATANVDFHTDQLIQQAIRSHFSTCTVLTIAHRIETILDSDRIVVLDNGSIIDVGTPSAMLRNKDSYINRLAHHLLAPNAQSS